ncbi:MAG TPA: NADH-quinone oxidoreductase subunit NuoG [Acidimicrobiales bacterium]|nr:NADH-quinone oxidoreductase subunit NuoG [Acidimicrobiales bacterium]
MTDLEGRTDLVTFTLNGREVAGRKGEQLIDACERNGVYIPRFCYHPRMRPVGMCRQCLVEVDTGRGPALTPSCMVNVTEGSSVDTDSHISKRAQEGVLEMLLINHPLDCPVCDKGGECPLQDQAYSHGPGESRFVEQKRHFEKPIPISATVYLDRERCILCDRCTRFASEVAGDPLIHFLDRGNETQVNTFPDEPFSSYFSGNTVQICPVGALTAAPYRFKARPWDLEQAESTCQTCSVGCRITVQTSRNRVLRYQGVDADPVNWGWLCDAGRFNFENIDHPDRLGEPLVRDESGELRPARWADALGAAASAIRQTIDGRGPDGVAVLGGARLTNEDAYAWAKLAKGVIGTDNVDAQLGDGLPAAAVLGLPRATIDQAAAPGGTILLLGPDPKEELPVLFLRLRHALAYDQARLVEITPAATGLTAFAGAAVRPLPGHTAEVVAAILAGRTTAAVGGADPAALAAAAGVLADTSRPLTVVLGRTTVAESADVVVEAAAAILAARPDARFLPALARGNVFGALDMGLAPGLLPGRVELDDGRAWFTDAWGSVPAAPGLDATGILTAAAEGRIDTLVLLGADPLADFPDADLAARALAGARTVIALDRFLTDSSSKADVVLPVAGFAECSGTTTNLEGRVSVVTQKVTPPGTARSDWMIAAELAFRLGADLGIESVEQAWAEVESLSPVHAGLTREVLERRANADGVVAPPAATPVGIGSPRTPIDPERTVESGPDAADAATEPTVESGDVVVADALAAHADQAADTATAGDADGDDAETPAEAADTDEAAAAPAPPSPLRFRAPDTTSTPGPLDAYALRLVATPTLYDRGTLLAHSPSLVELAPGPGLRLHRTDFDKLGVAEGDEVRVRSSSGSVLLPVSVHPGVPKGRAVVLTGQEGPQVTSLLSAGATAVDVRIEVP